MKNKHLTKEYLLESIKIIAKERNNYKYIIRTCDILIAKERVKLNNTLLSHDKLWILRDKRAKAIKSLRESENELKQYNKILTKLFYSNFITNNYIIEIER